MHRRSWFALVPVVATVALCALPASAGAATTNPSSLNFGNQAAGSTSPAKSTTLTTSCASLTVTCLSLPTDTVNVSVAVTGNFVATTDCPASLAPSLFGTPASCTIAVAFRPSGEGTRTGTLSTGTVGLLAPTAGPTVALSGNGVASTGGPGASSPAKKCKKKKAKKRSASAAKKHKKKCKKKKKRKHHAVTER
jgi:hypothetical protein